MFLLLLPSSTKCCSLWKHICHPRLFKFFFFWNSYRALEWWKDLSQQKASFPMKKALVGVVTKDLITYTTENRGHSCSVDRLAQSGCVCQPAQIACSKKELVILSTSSLGKLVKARNFRRLSLLLVFSFFPATFSRFSNRYSSRHLVRVYKGCEVHSRGGSQECWRTCGVIASTAI